MGSSWTRARTRVSCVGRWILNLCATREVPWHFFYIKIIDLFLSNTPTPLASPKFCFLLPLWSHFFSPFPMKLRRQQPVASRLDPCSLPTYPTVCSNSLKMQMVKHKSAPTAGSQHPCPPPLGQPQPKFAAYRSEPAYPIPGAPGPHGPLLPRLRVRSGC